MIITEFRERVPNSLARRLIGAVTVDERTGCYRISGRIKLDEVPILDRKASDGRLWLRDDPVRWARTCSRAFRSGYLVAVVTVDAGLQRERGISEV